MMKKLILFTFLATSINLYLAQTKVIAHKSHSGNSNTFAKAYQNNLFDMRNSNYGLPGNQTIFVLDTVVALNDTMTVVYKRASIVCHEWGTDYKKLKKNDFKSIKDTLINSEILNAGNSIAFIKANQHQVYSEVYFMNPFDEIVFIGFKPHDQWLEDCRPVSRTSIKKEK